MSFIIVPCGWYRLRRTLELAVKAVSWVRPAKERGPSVVTQLLQLMSRLCMWVFEL